MPAFGNAIVYTVHKLEPQQVQSEHSLRLPCLLLMGNEGIFSRLRRRVALHLVNRVSQHHLVSSNAPQQFHTHHHLLMDQ